MEGNLVMAYISGNISTAAIGNPSEKIGNGSAEFTGESAFRKMLAKALADNGLNPETGTNSIGDMMAGLLFGNVNHALKLRDTGNDASVNSKPGKLPEDDTAPAGFDEASPEVMQSMPGAADTMAVLAGLIREAGVGADRFVNREDNPCAIKIPDSQNDLTDSVQQADQFKGYDARMAVSAGAVREMTEFAGKMTEFAGEMTESAGKMTESAGKMTESAGKMTEPAGEMTESVESAQTKAVKSTGSLEQAGFRQIAPTTGMRETAIQPGMKISETGNRVQVKAAEQEQRIQKGIPASKDMPEMETDSIDDSLKAAACQSQIQRTGTTDAADVNRIPQPAGNAEAYSQIKDEILATLEQKGPTEFKMQLQPEELGQIDISLKISKGKLIIDILANKSQTQALLTSQVDKLISGMGLQNVQIESIHVGQQMNSDSQNNQNLGYQMNSGMDFSQGRQHFREAGESRHQISAGIFGSQTDLTEEGNAKVIQQKRDGFGRIDYVI